MNKKIAVIISPNWQNYAQKYLADCLLSLTKQNYSGEIKFWLIDNATTAESFILLQKMGQKYLADHVWVLLANQNNDGFAKGNNEAIRMAISEGYDYITLFNMDGLADQACLSELVEVAKSDKNIGAVQARIMLYPDKKKINSLGNITHFLGFGYPGHCQETFSDYRQFNLKTIAYPSGAAVLLKSEALKKVGLFDEKFWMYNEDQDLGWRLWLAGYRLVLASQAIFFHKYKFNRQADKYYWLDRNRLLAIFKNYHLATLALIFPALVLGEAGLFVVAIRDGWFKQKMRVWLYFCSPLTWIYLFRARRTSQALRRISDRKIIKLFSGKIIYQELDGPALRLANFFLSIYWTVVKKIVLW